MKVIFLDIDGVIQPLWKQERFKHIDEIETLAKELDAKFPGHSYYDYVTMDTYPGSFQSADSRKCNLGAVCFDWSKDAVNYLKEVLEEYDAKIVISSDWREQGEPTVRAFLAIYDMETYFYGMLDGISYCPPTERQERTRSYFLSLRKNHEPYDERAADIRDYLDVHPEITAYVTVDDLDLGFPVLGHFVHCNAGVIDKGKCLQMKEIIDIEDGPYKIRNISQQKQ